MHQLGCNILPKISAHCYKFKTKKNYNVVFSCILRSILWAMGVAQYDIWYRRYNGTVQILDNKPIDMF